jgi:Kazal-type serine protease inhibitor domain
MMMNTLGRIAFYFALTSVLLITFFTLGCGDDDDDDDDDCPACDDDSGDDDDGVACATDDECADAEYCSKEPGDCEGEGTCMDLPLACPEIWAPVCGCDGMTYANDCEANTTGTSVDHDGECFFEPDSCASSDECLSGQYCVKETEDCLGDGYCLDKPEACADFWAPVCGCDGNTYGNACFAAMAEVSVDYEGECAPPTCSDSDECIHGMYCSKDVGDCASDGWCVEKPEACADVWDPVCGCDGATYANACYAAMAEISVDYDGECAPPSCADNDECLVDVEYCAKEPEDCDGDGSCRDRPLICPDVWDPICGCDERTYANLCFAAMAGVNVDYDGACYIEPPVCTLNAECTPGVEYCAKEPEDCDGDGSCQDRPLACPDIWLPVCGCDGNTYGNECDAAMAGVNVDYDGECLPPVCTLNAECVADVEYCAKEPEDCDGDGSCLNRPVVCPDIWDPVCGCDERTYSNLCFAAMAGVNVDYDGACYIEPPVCTLNDECTVGVEYCSKEPGDCDGDGSCQDMPLACPGVWIPVCGCDGATHGNECDAAMAGVNVDYDGVCIPPDPPVHQWSLRFGDADANQKVLDLTTDPSGNIILLGYFDGELDIGTGMASEGFSDIFIAKYQSDGALAWIKRYGDASPQYAFSVTTDSAGNIYALGNFAGTVNFSEDPGDALDCAGSMDIYLAKLAPNGDHVWSQRYGDSDWQYGNDIAVDGAGNVIITGEFRGSVNFGGGVLTSAGGSDIYLAKFNTAGVHQWSDRFGDARSPQSGDAVTVDAVGNVYFGGSFEGDVDFGGGLVGNEGLSEIFMAKFTSGGALEWADSYGDADDESFGDIHIGPGGELYATGSFGGDINLGCGAMTSAGDKDIFLTRFIADTGACSWSDRYGDASLQYSQGLATDATGNLYLTGAFYGTVNFDLEDHTSANMRDLYIAKFNNAGANIWSGGFGGSADQESFAVAVHSPTEIYIGGYLFSMFNFGGETPWLVSDGQDDAFLAKLSN